MVKAGEELLLTSRGKKIARLTPGDLHYSVFVPSGSEANEIAILSAGRR